MLLDPNSKNLQILLRIFFTLWEKAVAATGLLLLPIVDRVMRSYRRVLCTCRVRVEGVLNQIAVF